MESMQDVFLALRADSVNRFLAGVIEKRFKEKGVTLSPSQRQALLEHLRTDKGEPFRIRKRFTRRREDITIVLGDEDAAIVEQLVKELDEMLPEILEKTVVRVAGGILEELHGGWARQERSLERERRGFLRRLDGRWGGAISTLRMMLTCAREFGERFPSMVQEGDGVELRLDALVRLHARACQVCDEIICLLSHGYADGAMARWRTLHEIAVVSLFLQEHGEETARRYLDHEPVETCKAAELYAGYCERLGHEPIPEADLLAARSARDEVLAKYPGEDFGWDWGWAEQALGHPRPNFAEIEKVTGLDHLRPYVKLACHNVHATRKGSLDRLGLLGGVDVLLAGASNAGLDDPGQNAAISLEQCSAALVALAPTLDSLVVMRILSQLADKAAKAFCAAGEQLELDAEMVPEEER